ncbi:MAG: YciI family protein [Alphaproteobacteria bacterium]
MYFIFNALDKKNSVELRTQNRQTHLEFLKTSEENNIKILLAGPRINENKQMIGSTLVVECENKDVLEKWLEKDIYNKVKLFENSEISEYKIVINNF